MRGRHRRVEFMKQKVEAVKAVLTPDQRALGDKLRYTFTK